MTITVVIPTLNRLDELGRCLETLRAQTRKPDELIVVDGAADPRIEALTAAQASAAGAVKWLPFRPGLTAARNHAIARATGDLVVFLDDDLLLEPEFLAEIERPFLEDSEGRVAGVAGDIVNYERDARPWIEFFKALFLLPRDGDGRFRASGAPTMFYGVGREMDVEFLPGGLTAWRREVFREFQFDENLPGIGINEDGDFSYRVSRKWRNRHNPKARVRHVRPESSAVRDASLEHLKLELAGYRYLYRKNMPKDPLHYAAARWHDAGVLLRHLFRRLKP
jgi:glycosyltransferase involved in cell wall biosynthesis